MKLSLAVLYKYHLPRILFITFNYIIKVNISKHFIACVYFLVSSFFTFVRESLRWKKRRRQFSRRSGEGRFRAPHRTVMLPVLRLILTSRWLRHKRVQHCRCAYLRVRRGNNSTDAFTLGTQQHTEIKFILTSLRYEKSSCVSVYLSISPTLSIIFPS